MREGRVQPASSSTGWRPLSPAAGPASDPRAGIVDLRLCRLCGKVQPTGNLQPCTGESSCSWTEYHQPINNSVPAIYVAFTPWQCYALPWRCVETYTYTYIECKYYAVSLYLFIIIIFGNKVMLCSSGGLEFTMQPRLALNLQ